MLYQNQKGRIARIVACALPFIAIVAFPLFVIIHTMDQSWMASCETHGFLGFKVLCPRLRLMVWALSAIAAFSVVALLWWAVSEFSGLQRIFEVPWFGIGEDVESVGAIESVARAAVFVVVVWLCLGVSALLWFGTRTFAALPVKETAPTSQTKDDATLQALAEIRRLYDGANARLDQHDRRLAALPEEKRNPPDQPPKPVDPGLVSFLPEMRRLNDNLANANTQLINYDRYRAALEQVEKKLVELSAQLPKHSLDSHGLDAIIGTFLAEIHRLNEGLNNTSLELKKHEQDHVAALDELKKKVKDLKAPPPQPGTEGTAPKRPADQQTSTLPDSDCIDVAAIRRARIVIAAAEPVPSSEPLPRYREHARHTVFFDIDSGRPSPGADQELARFVAAHDDNSAVWIHGSADPQGNPTANERLARRRAETVDKWLDDIRPRIIAVTAKAGAGEPDSEPYKRVVTIRLMQPCR